MPRPVYRPPSWIRINTPIEQHDGIAVKRDDLCCDSPSLAKIRGIERFVRKRRSFGAFGILDGTHSRNGWALARVCAAYGKQAVVYWPRYKRDAGRPNEEVEGVSRMHSRGLGAVSVPMQATRTSVIHARAKKDLAERYPNSILLPNAVKIPETVDAHQQEVAATHWHQDLRPYSSVVMTVGTGTIAAGVISGFFRLGLTPRVILHLGYSSDSDRLRTYIAKFTHFPQDRIEIVDEGFAYGQRPAHDNRSPFPACTQYEEKAWQWLQVVKDQLPSPILFWNSGS